MIPMKSMSSRPLDQADGLRRLFAHSQVCFVPVVSNPHLAFGGVMLERLCSGFAEQGCHTLVVDAAENSPEPGEMASVDLAACIESLSGEVSYLAARGLPLRHVNSRGSTAGLLDALERAVPAADVVLVHASASDLCRLFMNNDLLSRPRPLLLAEDRPSSVTHAYAAMKLLNQRAGLVDNWLRHVQDVRDAHEGFLAGLHESLQVNALVELNVLEQARNVCRTTVVTDAWQRGQTVVVHGWVYGLHNGLLEDLHITATTGTEVGPAYNTALALVKQRYRQQQERLLAVAVVPAGQHGVLHDA
jgi:hypothetical protein